MKIVFVERDRHLVEFLQEAVALHPSGHRDLERILGVAAGFKPRRPQHPITIVSCKCTDCGKDIFAINPCRNELESVGWCGCKKATTKSKPATARNCTVCAGYFKPRWDCGGCGGTGVAR